MKQPLTRIINSPLCWFALALLAFWLIYGPVVLFPGLWFEFPLPGRAILIIVLCTSIVGLLRQTPTIDTPLPVYVIPLLLCLYFASDLPLRPFGFSHTTTISSLFLALFSGIFLLRRWYRDYLLLGLLAISLASAIIGFGQTVGGALIFSDDHPSFLYRLIQLKENFPQIPFYNPLWNGGVEAREFFPSGALNIFILFSPLIYLFDVTTIYSAIVLCLLFIVLPLAGHMAARLGGYPARVGNIVALLVVTNSLLWYRWALSYGTLGFILSAGLVPINLIMIAQYLREKTQPTLIYSLFHVFSLTLMFLWSPIILFLLPLIFFALTRVRLIFSKRWSILIFLLLLVANLSWGLIFVRASKVGDFVSLSSVQTEVIATAKSKNVAHEERSRIRVGDRQLASLSLPKRLLSNLRKNLARFNPLLLYFGVVGLSLLTSRTQRRVYLLSSLSAGILALFGPELKPQLELERMFMVLGMALTLPAAIAITRLITRSSSHSPQLSFSAVVVIASLALSPFWLWRVTKSNTAEQFSTASPLVDELVEAISRYAGDGRTLFAGFSLHELSGGHLAPLAAWANKPLIARSYQHDRWRYTDIIPVEYLKRKQAGVLEYLDLMNVSLVITHDRFWRDWYTARPEIFEELWHQGHFRIFRYTQSENSYFLRGGGSILNSQGNRVVVELSSDEAILKFNYLPFLRSDNSGCLLSEEKISSSITFIRLSHCPQRQPITIAAQSPLTRFFTIEGNN